LDHDGHLLLPAVLTPGTVQRAIAALGRIDELEEEFAGTPEGRRKTELGFGRDPKPSPRAWGADGGRGQRDFIDVIAEHDAYLESFPGHPQLLALAQSVLGADIHWDHTTSIHNPRNFNNYHTHGYANDTPDTSGRGWPDLGFIRVFFYLNGFKLGDGNLHVLPGSHTFRRFPHGMLSADEVHSSDWIRGKTHRVTGKPLRVQELECPPGSVVVMWTHAVVSQLSEKHAKLAQKLGQLQPFYSCTPTGIHGPTCIFWAINLTCFSLYRRFGMGLGSH
jgi:hypothetical protein